MAFIHIESKKLATDDTSLIVATIASAARMSISTAKVSGKSLFWTCSSAEIAPRRPVTDANGSLITSIFAVNVNGRKTNSSSRWSAASTTQTIASVTQVLDELATSARPLIKPVASETTKSTTANHGERMPFIKSA